MTCEEVEMEVVGKAGELSEAACAHLAQCVSCARFARTQSLALGAVDEARRPSAALDQRVLAAVHERMAGQRRWRRLLRVGGAVLAPLAAAAVVLVGLWLRLQPATPSPGGVTLAAGGEQTPAAAVALVAADALSLADAEDQWLISVAMTDMEMDDLEEGIAQLIVGTRESSAAALKPLSRNDSGMTENRLEDFREKLMALEFELLGDM